MNGSLRQELENAMRQAGTPQQRAELVEEVVRELYEYVKATVTTRDPSLDVTDSRERTSLGKVLDAAITHADTGRVSGFGD